MKEKKDILFGLHCVHEALKAQKRQIYKILISKTRSFAGIKQIITLAQKSNIPIEYIKPELLNTMTKMSKHQGIAAETSFFSCK